MGNTSVFQRFQHLCEWISAYVFKLLKRKLNAVLFLMFSAFATIALVKWGLLCDDNQPLLYIQDICFNYANDRSTGNLCAVLCKPGAASSLNCHNFYHNKDTIFSGEWGNKSVMFKSPKKSLKDPLSTPSSEDDFTNMIKSTIKWRFNMSISDIDAKRMLYTIDSRNKPVTNAGMENSQILLQDNEYLALSLYEKFDIFPKLIGTCGALYAVQQLDNLQGFWQLITMYNSYEEWKKRVGMAILIMDYVKQLENDVPEPLMICDLKITHLGIANGKIKYLDLDSVHPVSVANKLTNNGKFCIQHSDCDINDCRSFCNFVTKRCQFGVANNNIQLICEKVFLGWAMTGRVVVPGLLLSVWTPRVLMELLELCANPNSDSSIPRAQPSKEITKRLYDLLLSLKIYYAG